MARRSTMQSLSAMLPSRLRSFMSGDQPLSLNDAASAIIADQTSSSTPAATLKTTERPPSPVRTIPTQAALSNNSRADADDADRGFSSDNSFDPLYDAASDLGSPREDALAIETDLTQTSPNQKQPTQPSRSNNSSREETDIVASPSLTQRSMPSPQTEFSRLSEVGRRAVDAINDYEPDDFEDFGFVDDFEQVQNHAGRQSRTSDFAFEKSVSSRECVEHADSG